MDEPRCNHVHVAKGRCTLPPHDEKTRHLWPNPDREGTAAGQALWDRAQAITNSRKPTALNKLLYFLRARKRAISEGKE